MFEDINEMEKEIKRFRENVLASSQLIEGMNLLIKESRNQQALMQRVSSDYQDTIKEISEHTIAKIEKLETKNAQKIKNTVESELSEAVLQITETNQTYIDALGNTDAWINAIRNDLSDKYDQFSSKMESVRVDKLIKTCTDLKKSMELKSNFIIFLVLAILVLEIVKIFF